MPFAQGTRGFVRPLPMTDEQMESIVLLTKQKVGTAGAEAGSMFDIGDVLEVLEGPFKGLQGPVLELGEGGEGLTLALTVKGRDTPVELPARHVAKI